ncbi:MAG: hypothetical protein WCW14_00230 [Candidatus Paceibacterota bacterium]
MKTQNARNPVEIETDREDDAISSFPYLEPILSKQMWSRLAFYIVLLIILITICVRSFAK